MKQIRYDAVFKARALELADEIGPQRAGKILGVTPRSLHLWMHLPLNGEPMKKELTPELKAALLEADEARKELKRIKKENEALKQANQILKEIAKVFSKDSQDKSSSGSLNSAKKNRN
jgi:transposase-like protein